MTVHELVEAVSQEGVSRHCAAMVRSSAGIPLPIVGVSLVTIAGEPRGVVLRTSYDSVADEVEHLRAEVKRWRDIARERLDAAHDVAQNVNQKGDHRCED